MRNNCSKEFNMKKTGIIIAAIALVAAAGTFAQPSAKAKNADAKNAPGFREPPKFEKPSDADLKAYHDAELQSYKILLDAQVKAKMVTQEWADARLAALKAMQADCKGFCFFFKGSHIYMADQIGRPHFGHKFHKRHNRGCKPDCGPRIERHHDGRGPRHQRKDFSGDAAPQGEDSAILNER